MDKTISRLRLTHTALPILGDVLIMVAALAVQLWWRQPEILVASTFAAFAPLFVLWLVALYTVGLYDLRRIRDFVDLIGSLLASAGACWMLGTMYFYLTSPYIGLAPKTNLLLTIAGAHVAFLLWRRLWLFVMSFSLLDLRILLLADECHWDYLRSSAYARFSAGLNLVNGLDAGLDLVVVDRTWAAADGPHARNQLVAAVASQVPIVSLDDFYESLFGKVAAIHTNDLSWAIDHVLPRSGAFYFKLKRIIDVVAAAGLLIVLSPLFAVLAIGIRIVDAGSPFYGQQRVGYLRRQFTLWKFRSMRPGADASGPFSASAGEDDPRVTGLGRLLRRYRLDELPQLWNVLRGDMSLVGPRPEWIKEVEILGTAVPSYHLRHLVPPGMTGWAQVYFRSTNNAEDSKEKHQYDLYYLKHFSLALDFTILLKTVKRVFISDSRVTTARAPFSQPARPSSNPGVDIGSIMTP